MATKDDDEAAASVADSSAPPDSEARTPFTTGDALARAVIAASEPSAPAPQPPLSGGQVVADVYEIVHALGAGGMGVVYLARDRRLARNVALKLIRTAPSSTSVARLVREAQAIARLTHPNVVTVYQIGTHDDQPFVAMEYVDGGTARSWLAARPRTWREIVALYVAAGRGLEAAHRAHLVHRDFKPDNVLVGDDGRVRVADFGLVHSATWSTEDAAEESGPASVTVTRTGMALGTPAYMAPEQRRGGAVDAAVDQYAFAVALWEALTGERPRRIDDEEPARIETPKRPMPRHIETALRRALGTSPAARWPNMGALLAEISRDPQARRRRMLYAGGGFLAIGAIAIPLAMRGASRPEPCGDSEEQIAQAWSSEPRAAVLASLGPRVGALVADNLDRYATMWTTTHRQACRDTRVTGSQSEDMLDRRMQCLFASRAAIEATVSALRTADADGKARATEAVGRLPALERCADIQALAQEQPLPTDPEIRGRLQEVQRELAGIEVADFAPKRRDRAERADAALARAREVGWKPLVGRALLAHAGQRKAARQVAEAIVELREAASIAVAGNLSDLGARAFAELATLLAEKDQVEAAGVALLTARAYGDIGTGVAQRVLMAGSSVASRGHKDDEAIDLARQLVASVDKGSPRELGMLNPMNSRHQLAAVIAASGRFDEALPVLDAAITWGSTNLGPDHAEVGKYRAVRASYYMNLGRYDDAIAEGEAALASLEAWYGPTSVHLADPLLTLGDAYSRAGKLPDVMPHLDRGLACARNGEDLEIIAAIQTQRTIYFLRIGDLESAAPAADALVAAAERAGDFNSLLEGLLVRGNVAKERKQFAAAERDFTRALEVGKPLGEHPAIQNFRVELGRTWLALGRTADVRTMLVRQLELLAAGPDIDPILGVETRLVLAASHHALGEKARARELVAEADRIATSNPGRDDLRALVDDWRAQHR